VIPCGDMQHSLLVHLYSGFSTTSLCLAIVLLANVNSSSRFSDCEIRYMLSPDRLSSVVCLSVTIVHPIQPVEIFSNVSWPFGTLATHSQKILRRPSQGTPPSEELNTRGVAKYSDFGPRLPCSCSFHIFSLCRLTALTMHNSLFHSGLKPTSFTNLSHLPATALTPQTLLPGRFFLSISVF